MLLDASLSLASSAASRMEEIMHSLSRFATSDLVPGNEDVTYEAPRLGTTGIEHMDLSTFQRTLFESRVCQRRGSCNVYPLLTLSPSDGRFFCAAVTLGASLFNASAPITIRAPSTEDTFMTIPASAVAQLASELQGPIVVRKVRQSSIVNIRPHF